MNIKETSKGRLYALTIPKSSETHRQLVHLDKYATKRLTQAQHLEQLQLNGRTLSKTVLIRRAVAVYCDMLIAMAEGKPQELLDIDIERDRMLFMARPPKAEACPSD